MRKFIPILLVGIISLAGGGILGGFIAITLTPTPYSWEDEYNDLLNDYDQLQNEYDTLVDDYWSLFYNLSAYQYIVENPLVGYSIPTVGEVLTWLTTDNTDTFNYTDGFWMCGDFAMMLCMRARLMNWRMRVACMFYSHSGDSGWLSTDGYDQYGEHGHAFNLILCQDGSDTGTDYDILYIEPQNDFAWTVVWSGASGHYAIYYVYAGSSYMVMGTNYWVNHYSYFA